MAQPTPALSNGQMNKVGAEDRAVHGWYRFVLGYPPHLVTKYFQQFGADQRHDVVFDPFCGCGTTPVEAKLQGFRTVGIDANPIAAFATTVKTTWDIPLRKLEDANRKILERFESALDEQGINTEVPPLFRQFGEGILNQHDHSVEPSAIKRMLPKELARVMPRGFISPLPYMKISLLRGLIDAEENEPIKNLYSLALAGILVEGVGNVGFGPEVYMTRPKKDAPVLKLFADKISMMLADLHLVQQFGMHRIESTVFSDDARTLSKLGDRKVDIVITSPPYPNEKDYTRSTRLESLILGFIRNIDDLRGIKRSLIQSNTRAILKGSDTDDSYVKKFARIQKLARTIENKRVELGKTSGFERLYHRVITLYYGGLYRHLSKLLPHLNRGARLAYVVGDQMSFFRIHIKTGELLAEIADDLGYKVDAIDLWRERLSTTTKQMLREEVVLLRKR